MLQTIFNMSGAVSRIIYTEPLGFDILQLRTMMIEQLNRKLGIIGVQLPAKMKEQLASMEPVIASRLHPSIKQVRLSDESQELIRVALTKLNLSSRLRQAPERVAHGRRSTVER